GAGRDVMIGHKGNDTYYVDNSLDIIIENPGEGTDTAMVSTNGYTLANNVENAVLIGSAVYVYGNSLDNTITGNSLDNQIDGGAGNDLIDGGAGADAMTGGLGQDAYYVDNAGDQVIESANAGTDAVLAWIDYTLGANVENLFLQGTVINGTGNALDNLIV